MGKYQGYDKYKDSGVEWLGEIPEHWEVKRLKFVATVQPSNVDKKTLDDEIPVLLCNYSDVYNHERITDEIEFMQATASQAEIRKFTINKGDVIITKDSENPNDIAVAALVTQDFDNVICGYHLTQIKQKDLDGNFLFRLFQCRKFNSQFIVSANGVTRFGLPQRAVNDAFVGFPPLDEQEKIARFLDYKTKQIDKLIAKKETLIEKLDEKRTALISHAVTKGLDVNVPMKDSGIEWLGEIPQHWEVKRLKYVCIINPSKSCISNFSKNTEVSFVPMEYVDNNGNINLEETKKIEEVWQGYTYFEDRDVIIAKITPCFENGKGALCKNLYNKIGFGSTEFHVLRAFPKKLLPELIYYLTQTTTFSSLGTAELYGVAGQKRVPESFLSNYLLGIPPLEEQQKIAEYLDQKTAQIEEQKTKIQQAIDLLKEYRTALITNAVTGKIDVSQVDIP